MEDVKLPEVAIVDADITKTCNVCKEVKLLKEFHPHKNCKFGVTGTCRSCNRERINKWYSDNRRHRQNNENRIRRNTKRLAVEYMGGECFDCKGVFPQCVYQFHHLDPTQKDFNPSNKRGFETMKPELDKCVMLCANCHMVRHYGGNDEQ